MKAQSFGGQIAVASKVALQRVDELGRILQLVTASEEQQRTSKFLVQIQRTQVKVLKIQPVAEVRIEIEIVIHIIRPVLLQVEDDFVLLDVVFQAYLHDCVQQAVLVVAIVQAVDELEALVT